MNRKQTHTRFINKLADQKVSDLADKIASTCMRYRPIHSLYVDGSAPDYDRLLYSVIDSSSVIGLSRDRGETNFIAQYRDHRRPLYYVDITISDVTLTYRVLHVRNGKRSISIVSNTPIVKEARLNRREINRRLSDTLLQFATNMKMF